MVALVAAGCGSSKSSSTSASSTTGSSSTAAPKASDLNPTSRDKLKDGGQVVWYADQYSSQWNFNELDGPEQSTAQILYGIVPYSLFNSNDNAELFVNKDY